jgi:hypothetical protein
MFYKLSFRPTHCVLGYNKCLNILCFLDKTFENNKCSVAGKNFLKVIKNVEYNEKR